MRYRAGTTDVPTAGTRVQINNTKDRVKSIAVKARPGNTGHVFFGGDDVSAATGWSLIPGQGQEIHFSNGSVTFDTFWVDAATNGDDLDWTAILE